MRVNTLDKVTIITDNYVTTQMPCSIQRMFTTTPQTLQTRRGSWSPSTGALPWPLTFPKWLCLHLQPDLDEVHRCAQPNRDHTGHHAGQKQVWQRVGRMGLRLLALVLAEEPVCVTEDPKHHRVINCNAGQGEGHALEEAEHLWENPGGGSMSARA